MYDLPYFKEKDPQVILRFIREHPFAMLIGTKGHSPVATQVPLMIGQRAGNTLFLRGHIMRKTDHHQAFQESAEALCVFTGAHTYVSARWYSEPGIASTWNYMSVQTRGTLRFLDEPALRTILEETTALFENDENSPALFRHLPKAYVDSLVGAIVGFEIEVREIENVFKLSQNRDGESYENIIRHLEKEQGDARIIAEEMRKRQHELSLGQKRSQP